jgi:hypothetical protein
VTATTGSLAAGRYTGTVTISSGGGTQTVPVSFVVFGSGGSTVTTNTGYKVIGWNDLGFHCFDGMDYSVFGVLPPYNTIHAHLIDPAGTLVTSPTGLTITYQAVADPLLNTMTTTSAPKTNFWQYAAALGFGNLAPDVGLAGFAMPGTSNTPQAMTFSTADNTWVATGIPEFPYADAATAPYPVNYFPMMKITATNSSGSVLASTDIVLPTSDEMSCKLCHWSQSGDIAAMPAAGWANNPDQAKDVKLNILRKHDDHFAGTPTFQAAMTAAGYTAASLSAEVSIQPILCAACHASNALSKAGYPGVPQLTTSMHSLHGGVINPTTGQTMDSGTTRDTCFTCHPGPVTRCLRGVMGILQASTGGYAIECQSCHGNLSALADPTRQGWLTEPNCQSCHIGTAVTAGTGGTLAYTSVFTSGTIERTTTDMTFATNPNTPAAGFSLYRYSSGHGGLQCEACHGSTHGEFTTSIVNDNVQSTTLQGHVGVLSECVACHGATTPSTTNGGPHGMHPIGSTWVSQHPDIVDSSGSTQCQPCHGLDYRGTILSKTLADRSLAGNSFPAGTIISCYSCHNGPGGG